MMLVSADDDDDGGVCASADGYPHPRWPSLHETERTKPLSQQEASVTNLHLPTKVTGIRGEKFNISTADTCNLIVTL